MIISNKGRYTLHQGKWGFVCWRWRLFRLDPVFHIGVVTDAPFCTFSTANLPVKNVFSWHVGSFNFTVIVHIRSKKNLKQVMHITAQYLSKGDWSSSCLNPLLARWLKVLLIMNGIWLRGRWALHHLFLKEPCACGTSSSTSLSWTQQREAPSCHLRSVNLCVRVCWEPSNFGTVYGHCSWIKNSL